MPAQVASSRMQSQASPAPATATSYGGMEDAGSNNNQISDGTGGSNEFSMDFLQFMGIDPLTPQNTIKELLAQAGDHPTYDTSAADQNGSAGVNGDGPSGGDAWNRKNGDHGHPGSVEATNAVSVEDGGNMDMPIDGQEENGGSASGAHGVQPLGPSQMMGISHEAPFGLPRDMELGLAALFQGPNPQTEEVQAAQAALLQHQVSTRLPVILMGSQCAWFSDAPAHDSRSSNRSTCSLQLCSTPPTLLHHITPSRRCTCKTQIITRRNHQCRWMDRDRMA